MITTISELEAFIKRVNVEDLFARSAAKCPNSDSVVVGHNSRRSKKSCRGAERPPQLIQM